MKKKHSIFTCLIFFLTIQFGFTDNNPKIDSLLNVYQHATIDSTKIKAINDLFAEYRTVDEEKASYYLNLAISLGEKSNYKIGYALSLYNKGLYIGRKGNFDSSDYYINKALLLYKELDQKRGIANCYKAFGLNMYDKGNNKEALTLFLQALKYYELTNDEKGISSCNTWIGNVYNVGMQQPEQALTFYEKALALQQKINDEQGMSFSYNNIGNVNFYLKNYTVALNNYIKSSTLKDKLGDKKGLSSSYNNIGSVYASLKQFDKAIEFLNRSLSIYESFDDQIGIISTYINIGNIYYEQAKYQDAINILEKALNASNDIGYKEGIREAAFALSSCYEEKGNHQKALELYKISTQINDSIINSDFNDQVIEMQTKYDVEKKDLEISKNKAEIENEKNKRYITYGALAFFVLLFSLAIWAFVQKRKNNRLLETKNSELENANTEISHQKEQLSEKQKEILDSINYAQKIQRALLASEEMLLENSLNHFILFKPKDIVSGDFTWATKKDNLLYLACCDSTGHGVPGAFMSLLNIGFLNEAIKERNITEPGKIFDYVRDRLIETIGKDEQKDGFDGILICIDERSNQIYYAAAHNAPLLISNNTLNTLSYDKMPVGKGIKDDSFKTYTLSYQKNDVLYLFTDGYADQFGGPKGKKFKYKQLEELLLNNHNLTLEVQKEKLVGEFNNWKGEMEQVDDVCIVGISL